MKGCDSSIVFLLLLACIEFIHRGYYKSFKLSYFYTYLKFNFMKLVAQSCWLTRRRSCSFLNEITAYLLLKRSDLRGQKEAC